MHLGHTEKDCLQVATTTIFPDNGSASSLILPHQRCSPSNHHPRYNQALLSEPEAVQKPFITYHYQKPLFSYVDNRQENKEKPSEKIFLAASRQANPNRDKSTEKINLPVGRPTERIILTGFSWGFPHRDIHAVKFS